MPWIAPPLTILFATETGDAAVMADFAGAKAKELALPARVIDAATYNTTQLPFERNLLFVTSTHEGEPPINAADVFDWFDEDCPPLRSLNFAVLALGDSAYDAFCAAGRRIDHCLEAHGAYRMMPRCDMDVGERAIAREWVANVLARFATTQREEGAAAHRPDSAAGPAGASS